MGHLREVRLGAQGRLALNIKSLSRLQSSINSAAKGLREDAKKGLSSPYAVISAFEAAQAATAAVRKGMLDVARDLDAALDLLAGKNVEATGPYSRAAAELSATCDTLSDAESQLVKSKAESIRGETVGRLTMVRLRVRDELEAEAKRSDSARTTFALAFCHSFVGYSDGGGPLRVSLSQAKSILGFASIPEDDEILGAVNDSPYAPPGSSGRKAAALVTLCRTIAKSGVLADSAALQKAVAPKPDTFANEVRALGD